jgi:hypothetical protein
MTTPEEFETKVRELFGIPLDYDLDSVPDNDIFDLLNGYNGGKTHVPGVAAGNFNTEDGHFDADKMMYAMLTELGYGKAVRIIDNIWKWYA